MKKIITLAVTFSVLLISNISAQPGCPSVTTLSSVTVPCGQTCTNLTATAFAGAQTTAYTVSSIPYSPPFAFNTGTPILVNTDDIWSGVIALPFHFCFFGNSYNQIIVGSNGVASFNITNANATNSWNIPGPIPSANTPDLTNCIMGPWHDIDPTRAGQIYYEIGGTSPCRYFKVSWYDVPYYSSDSSVAPIPYRCPGLPRCTQEIVIYETSNVIEMYIQQKDVCTLWNNGRAIQGIQNANGTVAYTVPGRNATQWSTTNDARRFTPNGAPNYTIAWFQGVTQIGSGNTINVCPPSSTVYTAKATYTDCDGSSIVVSSDVTVGLSPTAVSIDSVHQISCNGGSDGAVYASYTSQGPPTSFGWSPGGAGQTHLDGIPAGTYIFSITDSAGCTKSDTVTLIAPPQLLVTVPDTTLTVCSGNPTTTLTATPSGGTPGYTYSWTGGQTTQTITVGAGTYIVTVTDSKLCTANDAGTVTVITSNPTFNQPVITPASCSQTNGSIVVSLTGAANPITYNWSNGLPNNDTVTGLAGGTYFVTATDANGCSATASYIVNATNAILFRTPVLQDASCAGNDGSITVIVNSAAAQPINYNWSPALSNSNTQTGLTPGTYCVTATDANGCTATACLTIGQAAQPTFGQPVITNASCVGNDGSIVVTLNGATDPISYNWTNGLPDNDTVTGLSAGTYSVTATDGFGCSATASYNVSGTSISFGAPVITNSGCGGTNTGSIVVTVIGGTQPITYTWSNGLPNNDTVTGLGSGNYFVTATDANGCSATASYPIIKNPAFVLHEVSNVPASCGANNGSLIIATDGTEAPPVHYTWSNGLPDNDTLTGLAAGTYSVTAVDASGCVVLDSYTIGQGTSFTFGAPVITNTTCSGNTGSIVVDPNGATDPITYSWTNGLPDNDTVTGLAAGTYSVTATDANGCTASASYNVGQGGSFTFGPPVITNASCAGNNGSIVVTTNGATNPINYTWTNGLPNNDTVTGLAVGTYSVTATDANGCSATASYNVGQGGSFTFGTPVITNTSCAGNDGSIVVTTNGATNPVNYNWTNGLPNNDTVTGLAVGTYSVTATDANGCSASASYNVGQGSSITITNAQVNDVSCAGAGSIVITATGGSGTLTYSWSGGLSGNPLTGLQAGTYSLTITDQAGCSATASYIVGQSICGDCPAVSTNNNVTIPCGATCTTLSATAVAGHETSAYTGAPIAFNPPAAFNTGTQILVDTDDVYSDVITLPFNFCFFGNTYGQLIVGSNGVVSFDVANANQWNEYAIDPAGIPSPLPADLLNSIMGPWQDMDGDNIGEVRYTITGTYPCRRFIVSWYHMPMYGDPNSVSPTVLCPTNYEQTQQIVLYETTNVIDIYIQNKDHCDNWNGGLAVEGIQNSTGTVAYTVPGRNATVWDAVNDAYRFTPAGAPNYTINWFDGTTLIGTGDTITVCPDSTAMYNVQAVYTSCDLSTVTVSDSVLVTVLGGLTAQVDSVTNVSCNGGNDGAVYASYTTTGTVTSFGWAPGGAGQTSLTGIPAGTYIFTVTTSTGCSVSDTAVVGEPTPLVVNVPDTTIYNCQQTTVSASLTANASGGTPAYTYDWGGGIHTPTHSGLGVGTYTVTVTDANSCTATASGDVTLIVANPVFNQPVITNVSCNGAGDGSIVVSVSQATAPVDYFWSNNLPNNDTVTNLGPGTYTVTASDWNECSVTASYDITEPAAIVIGQATITDATCTVGGTISVTATGGTGTLTYGWSNSDSGSFIDSLAAGPYTLTVTDANGCTATASYTVNAAPNTVAFGQPVIVDVTCNGGNDGSITATATGGTGTITYTWNTTPVQNTATITGLTAGAYSVTISDASGCTASTTYTVNQPTAITPGTPVITPATCLVGGTITLTSTGGTGTLTYVWSNGDNGTLADSLPGGPVTVTITDASQCSVTATYNIPNQNAVSFGNSIVNNISCHGLNDGNIHVVVNGGTAPITYVWNPIGTSTDSIATGLSAGSYSVTITDAGGCSASTTYNITDPAALVLGAPVIVNVTCAQGGSITASGSGGTGNLTYSWSGQATLTGNPITNLAAGTYNLTLSDVNGCSVTASYTVAPATGAVSFGTPTLTQPTCNGGTNGSITVTTTGGTGQIGFVWNPGTSVTATNSPIGAGTYHVTATDQNGCSATASYTLGQPAAITLGQPQITPVTCSSPGSITVTASGGTGNLTLHWSNNDNGNTADSLAAGPITVTVTDASNCTVSATYTITTGTGTLVLGNPIINNVSCNGSNDGSITANATGGTGTITYTWANPPTVGPTITGLAPGSYTVSASDQGGCTVSATYNITEPAAMSVTINATALLCFGDTTGTATAVPSGGTGTIGYHWNDNETTPTITGLAVGIVLVTVTDANGCSASASTIIGQSPSISYNSQVNQPSCADLGFGTEILTPRGGTGAITITVPKLGIDTTLSMVGGDTVLTIPNVPTGVDTFTLCDAIGCCTTGYFFVNAGAANESFDVETDSTSCYGDRYHNGAITVTPTSQGNAPYTYSLNGGAFQSGNTFDSLTAGTYTLVTKNVYGCLDTLNPVVEQPAQVIVDAQPDTIVTAPNQGNQVTVNTQNFVNPVYTWYPTTGLVCADTTMCLTPTITVSENSVYYIQVYEATDKACAATDSVVIIITGDLKMPNAFSPNGDDKNDTYGPVHGDKSAFKVSDFRIFNRWGQMVHNSPENWDGKIDGKDQPAGTYIYYIAGTTPDPANPGTDKVEKAQGAFTLLR